MRSVNSIEKAQQLLARREHSRQELQYKLRQRGYAESDIQGALAWCAEKKWQCEQRFTEGYLRARAHKGYGPARIQTELQHKGVHRDLIERVIATTEIDWSSLAQRVYCKKFGNTAPKNFYEKRQRQQFMGYRGFGDFFTPQEDVAAQ